MIKCKICESEFIPRIDEHYVARDNGRSGLAAVVSNNEEQLYDAFDCPVCGCQVVVQERKRIFFNRLIDYQLETEDEDNYDE